MRTRTVALTTALLATAAFIVSPAANASAGAGTVETDITQAFGPQISAAGTATSLITPGNAATAAPAANTAWQSVNTTLTTLAADIKSSGSFSEADGEAILSDVQAYVSTVLSALSAAAGKSGVLVQAGQAQPFAATFGTFQANWQSAANALITAAPADLVPSMTSVDTQVTGAVIGVVDAYPAS